MTFIQRVPLFLFVFLIFNLVMATSPDLVVPKVITDTTTESAPAASEPEAPVTDAATPAPSAPAEPTPEPAAALNPDPATAATPAPAAVEAAAPASEPAPATIEEPAAAKTEAKEDAAKRVSISLKPLFQVTLPSKVLWYPSMNDVLLLLGVVVLYVELIKSARAPAGSIVEHMMSMFVFCAFLVEFLVHPSAGTSAFLVVTMLSLIDVVAGFMLASARSSHAAKA
jgi:hypothetical protein